MLTVIVGATCFVTGGVIGATVISILVVSKRADNAATTYYQNKT